jgi:4-hydroxythreonine-4-phosphate dehydrogenase
MKQRIAISIGDINGIGPEVILKSIQTYQDDSSHQFLIYAPKSVIQFYTDLYQLKLPLIFINDEELIPDKGTIVIDTFSQNVHPTPGVITKIAGDIALKSIKDAVQSILDGYTTSLVTAPISKESIQLAGSPHPGHTEYLSELTGNSPFTMMLVSDTMRVALATSHIPLKQVSETLTAKVIYDKINIIHHSLINDFGIKNPKIAVLGLNPHSGDGGVLGMEEIDTITPGIHQMNYAGLRCYGPFAADGWFGMRKYLEYDAVLAMYHDQGLVPFKALNFGNGVNYSAGLPIIRTSPDHGTAFTIAGKNLANYDSMLEAIKLAIILGQKRKGNL